MKLCINCDHHVELHGALLCKVPGMSPVTGEIEPRHAKLCGQMRHDNTLSGCGIEGKFFALKALQPMGNMTATEVMERIAEGADTRLREATPGQAKPARTEPAEPEPMPPTAKKAAVKKRGKSKVPKESHKAGSDEK